MLCFTCYRKSLSRKHNITVRYLSNNVTEDIIVREGAVGSITIAVSNTGMVDYQLMKIFVLCELNEIEGIMPTLPLHLKSGTVHIPDYGSGCPWPRFMPKISGSELCYMDTGLSHNLLIHCL
jgi:hypothetical protein